MPRGKQIDPKKMMIDAVVNSDGLGALSLVNISTDKSGEKWVSDLYGNRSRKSESDVALHYRPIAENRDIFQTVQQAQRGDTAGEQTQTVPLNTEGTQNGENRADARMGIGRAE